jgi:hypothetical protein
VEIDAGAGGKRKVGSNVMFNLREQPGHFVAVVEDREGLGTEAVALKGGAADLGGRVRAAGNRGLCEQLTVAVLLDYVAEDVAMILGYARGADAHVPRPSPEVRRLARRRAAGCPAAAEQVARLAWYFWAWIWGVAGALIAVPLTAACGIMCDHFERTRWIAKIISKD